MGFILQSPKELRTWQHSGSGDESGAKSRIVWIPVEDIFRSSPLYPAPSCCPSPTQTEPGRLFLLESKTEDLWNGGNQHTWETITILKTGRGWMLTCYHKYWHPRMLAARPVLWGRSLEDLGKFEKPKRKDLKTLRLFLNETTSTEYATVSYPFSQLIHRPFSWMQSFKYAC